MATQSLKRLAAILLPLLITGIFAVKTHLLSGGFYSADVNYRYQTNAFLLGHLALRDSPVQHLHDWAWSDGDYQIWGLGVPLLRLPFEAVARVFHARFPDRFVFLLLHFLAGVAVFTTAWGVESIFLRLSLLVLLLLNPHLQQLVGGNRFHVYEEAVAYNLLWALLGLALTLRCIAGPGAPESADKAERRWWLALAFVAGFSILIRPTGFLWGALSFVIFLWYRRKAGARLLPVCVVFLAGPLLALLANQLRFGTPWSFGHALALVDRAEVFFALHWGYPFQSEPFSSAARELFGGLWTSSSFNRWRSTTYRFREMYFGVNYDVLLLLAAGACLLPVFFRKVRAVRVINVLVVWALTSFSVLFLFYLRFDAITSRYLAEFAPSIYVALAAGVVVLFSISAGHLARRYVVMLGALFFIVLLVSEILYSSDQGGARRVDVTKSDTGRPDNVTADELVTKVAPWSFPQPLLPDEYRCGMSFTEQQITYNGFGWTSSGKCDVSEVTVLFFDHLECLELTYHSSIAPAIRVAVELEEWKQVLETNINEATVKLFCPAKPDLAHYKFSSIKQVVIGWVNPNELLSGRQSTLRLDSVRNASWPL